MAPDALLTLMQLRKLLRCGNQIGLKTPKDLTISSSDGGGGHDIAQVECEMGCLGHFQFTSRSSIVHLHLGVLIANSTAPSSLRNHAHRLSASWPKRRCSSMHRSSLIIARIPARTSGSFNQGCCLVSEGLTQTSSIRLDRSRRSANVVGRGRGNGMSQAGSCMSSSLAQ